MKHQKPVSKNKSVHPKSQPAKKDHKQLVQEDSQKPLKRWLGITVAVVGILLYISTAGYDFVLDDFSLIKENRLTKMGFSGIPEIMKTSYRTGYIMIDDEVYRPLSKVMFAIEWALVGDNPALGHWINILLYGLTGYLLFVTLYKYFNRNLLVPFIASLLFMAHPIHTEVVANIKSRDEILGFLFTVASMWFLHAYLLTEKSKHLFMAVLFFFIALLSKESYITFVALVPLLVYFFSDAAPAKNFRISAIMLAPALLYILIRRAVLGTSLPASQSIADNLLVAAPDIGSRIATAVYIMGIYVKLLFYPHPLVFDYSYKQIPIITPADWRFLLSFAIYLALFIFAVMRLRKKDPLSLSIFVFFIFISIYTNLVLIIGSSFAERFMYGPSLGFCLAVALLLSRFPGIIQMPAINNMGQFFRSYMKPVAITAVIVLLFSYKTISRNPVWTNNLTLYTNDVKLSPNSTRTHYYLGNLLTKDDYYKDFDSIAKIKMLDSAIHELQRSVDIYPKFSDAYNQMGVAYYRKKDLAKAFEKYQLALSANPTDATIHNNMGTVLFESGRYQDAVNAFMQAIRYKKDYPEAYANLGSAYGMMQQYDNAISYLQQAVKYDPGYAQAYFFLGITYRFKGDEANARIYLDKAKALDPNLK
jgi:hypothetical protein